MEPWRKYTRELGYPGKTLKKISPQRFTRRRISRNIAYLGHSDIHKNTYDTYVYTFTDTHIHRNKKLLYTLRSLPHPELSELPGELLHVSGDGVRKGEGRTLIWSKGDPTSLGESMPTGVGGVGYERIDPHPIGWAGSYLEKVCGAAANW